MSRTTASWWMLGLLILLSSFNPPTVHAGEEACGCSTVMGCSGKCGKGDLCSYGPKSCCPRGTLFQWSYGTSFSGGPDLNEPLVTDRPDFTEASSTVGLGVAQIEFGYTYSYNRDGAESVASNSYGEPLLRYGMLANWLEFRLALFPTEERTITNGARSSDSGLQDMYTGFKIALTPQECLLPEMAIIPQMNIPIGGPAFTSKNIEPGVNWIYAWEITDFISTAWFDTGQSPHRRRRHDLFGNGPILDDCLYAY